MAILYKFACIEIQGISSNVAGEALEDKVVNISEVLNINIKKKDIGGCHCHLNQNFFIHFDYCFESQ